MLKLNTPLIRTAALMAVVGSFSFAASAHAQDTDAASPPPAAADQAAPAAAPAPMHSGMKMKGHKDGAWNVETRIKTLHDKLKITAAEENDWNTVAQTMRDNEAQIHDLIEARHSNAESMTAIDDLQSYQQIAQAHADALQKLTASFKTLYSEMPEDQQKNADMVFGKFEGHHHGMHDMKKHS